MTNAELQKLVFDRVEEQRQKHGKQFEDWYDMASDHSMRDLAEIGWFVYRFDQWETDDPQPRMQAVQDEHGNWTGKEAP